MLKLTICSLLLTVVAYLLVIIRKFLTTMGKAKQPTPWEIAKPLLEQDYLDGTVSDSMKRGEVHRSRPEHMAVNINNFGTNFRKMKKDFKKLKQRAEEDALALQTNRMLCPKTPGRWDGSEAQRQLKECVDQGMPGYTTPKELWISNDECKKFDHIKFRGHVTQEKRSRVESNYWLNRKAKAAKKKAAAKAQLENTEFFVDDNDYF